MRFWREWGISPRLQAQGSYVVIAAQQAGLRPDRSGNQGGDRPQPLPGRVT
jgi:hypothetical protein